jgi:hypothetical protein
MVWGGIGWNYKSKLVFVEGNLNGVGYLSMLHEHKIIQDIITHFPDTVVYFQQDGAPAHRARATIKDLSGQITVIQDWPANSPDLSVIENVWGILKFRIATRAPKNSRELKDLLQEEWDKLEMETINGLFQTARERFRMCIKEEGRSIGHLVRKMGHPSENSPVKPPEGLMCVRQIRINHVGMIVQVHAYVTSIQCDRLDMAISWVQLEDLPEFTPTNVTPRKIRMMTGSDELRFVPVGSDRVVIAEVHGANGQFVSGAPEDIRNSLELRMYLRFLAIDQAEEPPHASADEEEDEERSRVPLGGMHPTMGKMRRNQEENPLSNRSILRTIENDWALN